MSLKQMKTCDGDQDDIDDDDDDDDDDDLQSDYFAIKNMILWRVVQCPDLQM